MKTKMVFSRKFAPQAGWKVIGGKRIYLRSKWEVKYAWYLEAQKEKGVILDWEYEPKTFWFEGIKRGTNSYKPDFLVCVAQDQRYWVEVKGYMDSKSKTKIKRFLKGFPEEKLIVVDAKWFNNMKPRRGSKCIS